MEREDLIKLRDTFKESAEIIDEILLLQDREYNGEDVTKETESALGRFMIKMMQLNDLK